LTGSVAGRYSDANQWAHGSGNLLFDVSPRLRLGPELTWQGNDDVRVQETGAIVGVPMGEGWIYLRGGRATTRSRNGDERTEPYFSAGIGRNF
jgi:hypothetical protein